MKEHAGSSPWSETDIILSSLAHITAEIEQVENLGFSSAPLSPVGTQGAGHFGDRGALSHPFRLSPPPFSPRFDGSEHFRGWYPRPDSYLLEDGGHRASSDRSPLNHSEAGRAKEPGQATVPRSRSEFPRSFSSMDSLTVSYGWKLDVVRGSYIHAGVSLSLQLLAKGTDPITTGDLADSSV